MGKAMKGDVLAKMVRKLARENGMDVSCKDELAGVSPMHPDKSPKIKTMTFKMPSKSVNFFGKPKYHTGTMTLDSEKLYSGLSDVAVQPVGTGDFNPFYEFNRELQNNYS